MKNHRHTRFLESDRNISLVDSKIRVNHNFADTFMKHKINRNLNKYDPPIGVAGVEIWDQIRFKDWDRQTDTHRAVSIEWLPQLKR